MKNRIATITQETRDEDREFDVDDDDYYHDEPDEEEPDGGVPPEEES